MPRIALLSTSDTDLLSARASGADYALANPARLDAAADLPAVLGGADLVIVRILGTARTWPDGLDVLTDRGLPTVVLGGEQTPDAELMRLSTVPIGIAAQAHAYLAEGGADNLRQLHAFAGDTVLLTGAGFDPPVSIPPWGYLERDAPAPDRDGTRSRVGILIYRAHHTSGNTAFVHALADAVDATGDAVAVPMFCSSLRAAPPDLLRALGGLDALIVTVLAAGGTTPADASAGGDDDGWDVSELAALDIPILQGLCLTWSRAAWAATDDGLSPLDVATQVAVPEFDGRIITVPFSFKETDPADAAGLPRYVADPERCARVAAIAAAHARLRHTAPADRRIGLVLSAYPTKHSRIGNAVGLDTPVSAVRLLRAMRHAGYDIGSALPGLDTVEAAPGEAPDTTAGNALIHGLIDAGGQDEEWLTAEQLAGQPVRIPAAQYRQWFADLPADLQEAVTRTWGPAPGELFVDRSRDPEGEIVLATLQSGNVVILVQPPRGFGENPIAIYHDPDLPPSHHYLACYRWLERGFGAHALVHLGKHGNLEWLPGKNVGMSAGCGTDAALGSVPLIYPFLVNDPGEGTRPSGGRTRSSSIT